MHKWLRDRLFGRHVRIERTVNGILKTDALRNHGEHGDARFFHFCCDAGIRDQLLGNIAFDRFERRDGLWRPVKDFCNHIAVFQFAKNKFADSDPFKECRILRRHVIHRLEIFDTAFGFGLRLVIIGIRLSKIDFFIDDLMPGNRITFFGCERFHGFGADICQF